MPPGLKNHSSLIISGTHHSTNISAGAKRIPNQTSNPEGISPEKEPLAKEKQMPTKNTQRPHVS